MKAYLVLDLTVNDYPGFRNTSAKSLRTSPGIRENTLFRAFSQTTIEGDWKPDAWSSSNSRPARMPRHF